MIACPRCEKEVFTKTQKFLMFLLGKKYKCPHCGAVVYINRFWFSMIVPVLLVVLMIGEILRGISLDVSSWGMVISTVILLPLLVVYSKVSYDVYSVSEEVE